MIAKFVPEPEIYQCHFFVGLHEKKKYAACLVLSNAALYVCTLKSGMPAAVKEKYPAEKITALAAVPGNDHALKVTMGDITAICITADAQDCNALFVFFTFPPSHGSIFFSLCFCCFSGYELRRLVWDTRRVSIPIQQPPQQQ